MKKILRLTESELVGLIKRSLNEQTILNPKPPATPETLIPGMTRKGVLEKIWCSLQFGKITAQVPNWKGKQWCSKGGFRETFKVTEDEDYDLYKKCPVYSTPELQNKKEGWTEIYNFFDSAKDGFKRESNVEQYTCDNYYSFDGKTNKGASVRIYSDGDLNYTPKQGRGLQGTWSWDGTKPVFNLPFTKKAVGYAQTEEDITQNKKILNVGSRGDLVKRIQYEILSDTDGKINPGCKKGDDGKHKPSSCDGIFGAKTKNGIKDFQTRNGLRDKSGIVGAETWNALAPPSIDYEGRIYD